METKQGIRRKIAISVAFLCCAVLLNEARVYCDERSGAMAVNMEAFELAAKEAQVTDGAKLITYKQFMDIRSSGEPYTLLDVLSSESYESGHIEGAVSFPLDTINEESAAKKFSKDANIIVYCGSFQCHASTAAAKRLSGFGYNVLDYKGGLKEWTDKGNKLVK